MNRARADMEELQRRLQQKHQDDDKQHEPAGAAAPDSGSPAVAGREGRGPSSPPTTLPRGRHDHCALQQANDTAPTERENPSR